MTKADVYAPKRGTLPHKVIEFLTSHPDEVLTKEDVGAKFDLPPNHVHSKLGLAVEVGALTLKEDLAVGELVYSLGTGCAHIPPAPGRHPTLAHAPFGGAAPRKTPVRFDIDMGSVVIRDAVPLPARRGDKKIDWNPLMERLQVGQMFEVPKAAKYTLGSAITRWKKDSERVFEMRSLGDNVGVWRTR